MVCICGRLLNNASVPRSAYMRISILKICASLMMCLCPVVQARCVADLTNALCVQQVRWTTFWWCVSVLLFKHTVLLTYLTNALCVRQVRWTTFWWCPWPTSTPWRWTVTTPASGTWWVLSLPVVYPFVGATREILIQKIYFEGVVLWNSIDLENLLMPREFNGPPWNIYCLKSAHCRGSPSS